MSLGDAFLPSETFVPLGVSVRTTIRDRIASGDLAPGARLKERDLAGELGVSRLPVREALRQLEIEGYVVSVPRRGVVVRGLNPAEVGELFDVWGVLYLEVCLRVARRIRAGEVAELPPFLGRMEKVQAEGRDAEFPQIAAEFHDWLLDAAGVGLLASILEPLNARVHGLMSRSDAPEAALAQYRRLTQALLADDAPAIGEAVTQRVADLRAHALDGLPGSTPDL